MTQYDWVMTSSPQEGTRITLVQLASEKTFKFFLADRSLIPERVAEHMDSLTDDLCEQWFKENLSKEELKVRQAAFKAKQRQEREELEAKVAAQRAETARLKAEEKAAEKARKRK